MSAALQPFVIWGEPELGGTSTHLKILSRFLFCELLSLNSYNIFAFTTSQGRSSTVLLHMVWQDASFCLFWTWNPTISFDASWYQIILDETGDNWSLSTIPLLTRIWWFSVKSLLAQSFSLSHLLYGSYSMLCVTLAAILRCFWTFTFFLLRLNQSCTWNSGYRLTLVSCHGVMMLSALLSTCSVLSMVIIISYISFSFSMTQRPKLMLSWSNIS